MLPLFQTGVAYCRPRSSIRAPSTAVGWNPRSVPITVLNPKHKRHGRQKDGDRIILLSEDCHSPLPDWIVDAGELVLGVDTGAPQDSRRGILVINSNSN